MYEEVQTVQNTARESYYRAKAFPRVTSLAADATVGSDTLVQRAEEPGQKAFEQAFRKWLEGDGN